MAEQIEMDLQSAISLRTITDFNLYGLFLSPCCVDVKLTAPPYSASGEIRAPIDLVAVIDRSGSMSGGKLKLVAKVLHFVAQHLKSIDRLSIVTYDSNIEELVSLINITHKNREEIDAKIERICTGGSTNLSGGLLKGMNIMKNRTVKADVASVLLFTDGMANIGITDTAGILTAMTNEFGGHKYFTVNTFGFGSDHNAHMLKEISRVGNGLFYYIQNIDQIPQIFTNCLGGLLSTLAQNISISIQTLSGATINKILSKNTPKLSDDNKQGTVSMGDMQSEEEKDILVELNLSQVNMAINQAYIKVSLEYFNVIKKDNDQQNTEVVIDRRTDISKRESSLEVDEQRNRFNTIDSLIESTKLAEEGRMKEAATVISDQQQRNYRSRSSGSFRMSSLNNDLDNAVKTLSSKDEYIHGGNSSLLSMTDSHRSQRTTSWTSYRTSSHHDTYSCYEIPERNIPEITRKTVQSIPLQLPKKELIQSSPVLPAHPNGNPPVATRDSAKGPSFINEL